MFPKLKSFAVNNRKEENIEFTYEYEEEGYSRDDEGKMTKADPAAVESFRKSLSVSWIRN